MTITGAIVLFAVIWFMGLLIALPLGLRTHGDTPSDEGHNTLEKGGDHAADWSPVNPNIKSKMWRVTWITVILWAPLCLLIASGLISVHDLDIWGRMDR